MKIHPTKFLPASLTLLAVTAINAQTIDSVVVLKTFNNVQTGSGTTAAASTNPVGFSAKVSGSGLSGLTGLTVSLPSGSGFSGGSMGYNADSSSWNYGTGPTFPEEIGFANSPARNAAFANGPADNSVIKTYTFNIPATTQPATTVHLNLQGTTTAVTTPFATFSNVGGYWSGNVYYFDPTQSLTITSNANASYGANADSFMTSELNDANASLITGAQKLYSADGGSNTLTLTINPNQLSAGQSYYGFMAYTGISYKSTELAGSINAAGFELTTTYTISAISAIPEPSTYAAFAGLGALGLAIWRRKRPVA